MHITLFQSSMWEKFKLETGYQKSYRVQSILVLQKRLPAGFTMLYSPMINEEQWIEIKEHFPEFMEEIKKIAYQNKAIFYRIEFDISLIEKNKVSLPKSFVASFEEMQPLNNWLIDLTKSEEEILKEMKQKGRYNIKVAMKNGVTTSWSSDFDINIESFYKHYSETGRRHKISYRNKQYFEKLVEIFGKNGYARTYIASKDGVPLASAIMLYYSKEALYLYGGSSDQLKNIKAPCLLLWKTIKDAKELGCERYNFLGIAPDDNPDHSWAGITKFKKQFGGFQKDIIGCFDLPIKPLAYNLFKLAEKIRRR